jgi:hypothetical protein
VRDDRTYRTAASAAFLTFAVAAFDLAGCTGTEPTRRPPPGGGGGGMSGDGGTGGGFGGSGGTPGGFGGTGGTAGRGGSGGAGGGAGGSGGAVTGGSGGSGGGGGVGGSGGATGGAGGAAGASDGGGGRDSGAGGGSPERGEVGAPGFPGWRFSKVITMNTTAGGAAVMGNVENYPVAVALNAQNFDFTQAKALGEDLRFGAADGTPLPYHVEMWDQTAKVGAAWVRVPRVMGNSEAQSINMYWGNAAAGDAGDSKAVFSADAGFIGVWHLNEDGNTAADGYKDASAAGAHGMGMNMAAGSRIDARVGKGQKLVNAMEQWISVAEPGTRFRPAQMTASIWGKADSFPGRSGPGGYDTIFSSGEYWTVQKIGRGATWESCFQHNCAIGRIPVSTNTWYHFTLVRSGNSHRLWINGVADGSGGVATRADAKPLGIGNQTQYLTNAGEKRSWNGTIDEARVLNVAKDGNWIKLDFESQKEGSKFLSFGATVPR